MENNPILSLCFPTYNRCVFLGKQLERLFSISSLLLEKVEIIVSDNCSTDDTESIVRDYIERGFSIKYYKNSHNLGMDGNFVSCFKKATGKYVWLLGDDDILIEPRFEQLLSFLSDGNYGLVHIYQKNNKDSINYVIYDDDNLFCRKISYYSTFISANIVQTKYVPEIDFDKYMGTWFTLMPLYIRSLHKEKFNAIIYYDVFDPHKDAKRNGGYNFFKVFVENYLNIWKESLDEKIIDKNTFNYLKKDIYIDKISNGIRDFLIRNHESNFSTNGAWKILIKYYGQSPYAYIELLKNLIKSGINKILNR